MDLRGGLAGIALTLAHFGMRDAAGEIAGAVADRLDEEEPRAGLVRGSSGAALMFIRLYEQTGDAGLLDLAATALRKDLRRCVPAAGGALMVDEGRRTMPYLADGSVGIGVVLDDYLAHRQDTSFADAAAAIRLAAVAQFYAQPGLFYGRAGMIAYLGRRADPARDAQVRRLRWHALAYRDRLAFPGEGLLRLSMDLSSGTAGVMLALAIAQNQYAAQLPFLTPIGEAR